MTVCSEAIASIASSLSRERVLDVGELAGLLAQEQPHRRVRQQRLAVLVVEVRELLADRDQPQRVVAERRHELVEPAAGRRPLDQLPRLIDHQKAAPRPGVLGALAGEVLGARVARSGT